MTVSPDGLARAIDTIGRSDAFDVAVLGYHDRTAPWDYERAGATWWLETIHDRRASFEELLDRVRAGP